MDARRNQVYTGLYSYIEDGQSDEQEQRFHYTLVPILSQCAVPIEEIAEKCNEQQKEIIFLGDGVPVFAEQLKNLMKVPYSFAPAHMKSCVRGKWFRQQIMHRNICGFPRQSGRRQQRGRSNDYNTPFGRKGCNGGK